MAVDINLISAVVALGVGLAAGFGAGMATRPKPGSTPADVEAQLYKLRAELDEQAKKSEALPNLLASLSSIDEPEKLYSSIGFVTREHLSAEYSALFLRRDKDYVIQAGEGISDETRNNFRLASKEGLVRYIMETNAPVRLDRGDRQLALFRGMREPVRDVMVAPLRTGADVFGLLFVANKTNGGQFSKGDLNLVSYLAIPFSLAIHNSTLFTSSQRTVVDMLIEVSRQSEDRDHFTKGHSLRVADLAVRVGKQLRMSPGDLETLRIAARLHDLGKMSIPLEIWNKPGPLSDEEKEVMRSHPRRAVDLLKPLGYVDRALPLILYHHERYDGSGYPSGLRGAAIPVGAMVIGMAEAFDALISDRPYRKAIPIPEAHRMMSEMAGTQFDPQLLRPFLQVVEQHIAKPGVV